MDLNYDEVITKDELSKFIFNASKMVGLIYHHQEQCAREPLVVLSMNQNHLQHSTGYSKARKSAQININVNEHKN